MYFPYYNNMLMAKQGFCAEEDIEEEEEFLLKGYI